MSNQIFDEYNLRTKNLTVPFSNENILFKDCYRGGRNNQYPLGLAIGKTTVGVIKGSDYLHRETLPILANSSLVQLEGLREPGVNNIGLVWGVRDDLAISSERGVPMKTNTELLMEMDTFTDGVRKVNPIPKDPNWRQKQAYADWATNIQRSNILGQNDLYKDEAKKLAEDAWDQLYRKAPSVYDKMRAPRGTPPVMPGPIPRQPQVPQVPQVPLPQVPLPYVEFEGWSDKEKNDYNKFIKQQNQKAKQSIDEGIKQAINSFEKSFGIIPVDEQVIKANEVRDELVLKWAEIAKNKKAIIGGIKNAGLDESLYPEILKFIDPSINSYRSKKSIDEGVKRAIDLYAQSLPNEEKELDAIIEKVLDELEIDKFNLDKINNIKKNSKDSMKEYLEVKDKIKKELIKQNKISLPIDEKEQILKEDELRQEYDEYSNRIPRELDILLDMDTQSFRQLNKENRKKIYDYLIETKAKDKTPVTKQVLKNRIRKHIDFIVRTTIPIILSPKKK